jgi:type IX secretion system PorP/SprF family membrane protein
MKNRFLRYRLLLFLVLVHGSLVVLAQREVHFSQYMYQGILINPAYAGNQNQVQATLGYKSQWNGLKSTPTVMAFTLHGPIIHQSAGLGLQMNRETFGKSSQLAILGCFSYKVRINKGVLAMGVETGFRQYAINIRDLVIEDPTDPNIAPTQTFNKFDLGFGMYYQTDKSHVGLTAKKLNGNAFQQAPLVSINPQQYYTLFAGRKWNMGNKSKLLLSCFLNYSFQQTTLGEGNAIYQSNLGLVVGLGYRSTHELIAMVGLNMKKLIPAVTEDLTIGYAYDYGFTALQDMNYGAHEILLCYRFATKPTVSQILNDKKAVHPIFF